MYLTLNLGTSYKTGLVFLSNSYDFMFERIMCVLVKNKDRGHLVISIVQFMNVKVFADFLYMLPVPIYRLRQSTRVVKEIADDKS